MEVNGMLRFMDVSRTPFFDAETLQNTSSKIQRDLSLS